MEHLRRKFSCPEFPDYCRWW